jgi:hypothetical protein
LDQQELRELTRFRSTFVKERANIKLSSVASDVLGVSGRAMLEAIIAGTATPEQMAELSKGRMHNKRTELSQALAGWLSFLNKYQPKASRWSRYCNWWSDSMELH